MKKTVRISAVMMFVIMILSITFSHASDKPIIKNGKQMMQCVRINDGVDIVWFSGALSESTEKGFVADVLITRWEGNKTASVGEQDANFINLCETRIGQTYKSGIYRVITDGGVPARMVGEERNQAYVSVTIPFKNLYKDYWKK